MSVTKIIDVRGQDVFALTTAWHNAVLSNSPCCIQFDKKFYNFFEQELLQPAEEAEHDISHIDYEWF